MNKSYSLQAEINSSTSAGRTLLQRNECMENTATSAQHKTSGCLKHIKKAKIQVKGLYLYLCYAGCWAQIKCQFSRFSVIKLYMETL